MTRSAAGLLVLVVATVVACPAAAQKRERIVDFHSDITVQADASLTVRETIRVHSTGQQIRHGIYRDFPTQYHDQLGNRYSVGFRVDGVQCDGHPEDFHLANLANGTRIYIGKSTTLVPAGDHVYVIDYSADRELGFFADHDELYWNVTGNGWDFPIDAASATVMLPPDAARDVRNHEAYTGPQGARGRAYTSSVDPLGGVTFATTAPLPPHAGLTIVVAWPKGVVPQPTAATRVTYFLRDNPNTVSALLGGGLLLSYYLFAWLLVGRDPERGTIIPLYHPPAQLSPAAARYLTQMGYDDKAFAAALIDMAVKGYLTIRESDGVYDLVKRPGGGAALSQEESAAAAVLLASSSEIRLRNTNHETIRAAITALTAALKGRFDSTYFIANSRYSLVGWLLSLPVLAYAIRPAHDTGAAVFLCVWLAVWTVAVFGLVSAAVTGWRALLRGGAGLTTLPAALVMTAMAAAFLGFEGFGLWAFAQSASPVSAGLLVVLVGMNVVFYRLLKAPTAAGRVLLDQLEGFRLYLSVAEQDRLNLLNPPERTPALFETYLPYALALDVEQQWAQQFADVLTRAGESQGPYTPTWYSGGEWNSKAPRLFAAALGSSVASAVSSSSSAPGSSSGGGGGGSSGGGGGGGGGGGW